MTGKIDLSELKYISDSFVVPPEKIAIRGTVLMCMANGSKSHLGKVALVDEDYGYAFGGFMGLIVPSSDIVPSYLYWILSGYGFKRLIESLTDGANINNLKFADIAGFEFPLPPLPVQREIVARLERELGAVDKLAKKFEELEAAAKAEFKAELKETFEEIKHRGEMHRRSFASEGRFGEAEPEGRASVCETQRLGDVCTLLTDGDWIESKDQSPDGIRLVQTGNVGFGRFENKEKHSRFITVDTFRRLRCTEIFPGDVLISRLPDPVGRACIVPDIGQRMITAVDCSIARFDERVDTEYFVLYSQSLQYDFAISEKLTGSTRQRISRSNLSQIEIPVPSFAVQREVVARLDAAKAKKEKLVAAARRGCETAALMRKAILKEAFE